jgi:RNA polymerase sigma-70 factor, ECF subfamily
MNDRFEAHRPLLRGLAYRMLGSVAEAEDVVQDAWLRWQGVENVVDDRAWLARTTTRLCLDRLKSARARRESYVGIWLPEPYVDDAPADDVGVALLLTLERLTPLERAAFLLHDVFDLDFAEVAASLGRSEAACRQLAARARAHVRSEKPRFTPSADAATRLADAFHAAMVAGDLAGITALLAEDAVFWSDGGGQRDAALRPVHGRDRIRRFLFGLASQGRLIAPTSIDRATINGLPGFVVRTPDGVETMALEVDGDAIAAIYAVRNPEKLRHLR